jgi:hypothetical protein
MSASCWVRERPLGDKHRGGQAQLLRAMPARGLGYIGDHDRDFHPLGEAAVRISAMARKLEPRPERRFRAGRPSLSGPNQDSPAAIKEDGRALRSCVLHPALALYHAADYVELFFGSIEQVFGARELGCGNGRDQSELPC